jgi:rfaE bifunctional protein kinase chain/domain
VRIEQLLGQEGVATLFKRDRDLHTIVKLRIIGRSQQLIRIDFEKPPQHEVLEAMYGLYETSLPQMAAVLFSDYGKGGLAHIQRMIGLARAAGRPVLVDPKGSDYTRYAGASVITPNRAELAQVIGPWSSEQQLHERAQALRRELGIANILLTRSEEGMSLFDEHGVAHVPAQAREVFDVTGAGDTVAATMAALLACGLPPRQAMPIANRAGGIVVGKFGTATVSYEELFA